MPLSSKKALEESVVKLQLRVASLERYTNELVAAVDAMLATHKPDPPPPAPPQSSHKTARDSEELQARFDDLQDVMVKRLQEYVESTVAAAMAEHVSRTSTPNSPLPVNPTQCSSSSSSSSSSSGDNKDGQVQALAHDLLQCVSQIESLIDDQQQHREDMETCMALLLRLEKRQDAMERARAPSVASRESEQRQVTPNKLACCHRCHALSDRVTGLEKLVRNLCTERSHRARSEDTASIMRAAAQLGPTPMAQATDVSSSSSVLPLPPSGNEKALWARLCTLSHQVATHSEVLAEWERQYAPQPQPQPQPQTVQRRSSSRQLLSPPRGSSAENSVRPTREIEMEETPQALRQLEARVRGMQASLETLA